MNIFAIEGEKNNIDWYQSAVSLDNLRVVKMILETTQLLCTGLNENDIQTPYKSFNPKHPSCIWAIESSANWLQLLRYGKYLINEYSYRFKKEHKCEKILDICEVLYCHGPSFSNSQITPLRMAMPEQFKDPNDIVGSYRRYYVTKPNMIYPGEHIPDWFCKMRKLPFKVKDSNGKIEVIEL